MADSLPNSLSPWELVVNHFQFLRMVLDYKPTVSDFNSQIGLDFAL